MGRAKEFMIEQQHNIENGDKRSWIENKMQWDKKEFDEDSEEWNALSEEFDSLKDNNDFYVDVDYVEEGYVTNNKTSSKNIKPVIYNESSFRGMREGGFVLNKDEYTIAHYETDNNRLEDVAENIKTHIDEHFVLYDYKGTINTNSKIVIRVLKGIYGNEVNTKDGDLLHIMDEIEHYTPVEPSNNSLKTEHDMTNYVIDKLIQIGYPENSIILNKKLYDTKYGLDISIENENQIIAVIEIKKMLNKKHENTELEYLAKSQNQLYKYNSIIIKKQTLQPKLFLVEFLINNTLLYEYVPSKDKFTALNAFPTYESLTKDEVIKKENTKIYASFDKDVPHEEDVDSLGITQDINAFAKLISYKQLPMPLSIGLFGKWGSGKSFFMEKLSKKIEQLSRIKEDDTFCSDVVHVKFNAWHYSDTNLWASLINKIFTEIDNKINKVSNKNEVEIQKSLLYKELESTKKLIVKKEEEEKRLRIRKETIEEDIKDKQEKIKSSKDKLKAEDFDTKILDEPIIKEGISSIKSKFQINQDLNIKDITSQYKEIKDTFGIYKKALLLLINNINYSWLTFFVVLIPCIIFIFYKWLDISSLKSTLTSIAIYISAFYILIKNKVKELRPYTKILKNIIDKHEERIKAKEKEEQKNIEELTNQINKLNQSKDKIVEKQKNIEEEIKDIENGKYFKEFISSKIVSNDYTKHLGLISIVREDLKKLEYFLPQQIENKKYNIDRIVLYIDDLDRCPDDLVIDILEAVHLLLAFDLFVVIVGVDSRWIKGSLKNKYKNFSDDEVKITPKQYIEKIFQIPFKIKTLNKEDKQRLISNLLKADNKENTHEKEKVTLITSNGEPLVTNNGEPLVINNTNPIQEEKLKSEVDDELHEKLTLEDKEIVYIEEVAHIIGETPRAIKRFINTYRIIRSHEEINKTIHNHPKAYKLIVLLLCETLWEEKVTTKNNTFNDLLKANNKEDDYNSNVTIKKDLAEFIKRFSFNL